MRSDGGTAPTMRDNSAAQHVEKNRNTYENSKQQKQERNKASESEIENKPAKHIKTT